ncbi:MAG: methyltransferase domain-containing protein [Candidatus Eremiobacteraeota bacterium]|nr:methyltransferase domain-containing protein [Candidatus Eremiobacteraeota bacterium]
MKSHPVSESIRGLYEAFPYPSRIPGGSADPFLEYIWSFSGKPHGNPRSFLDAGCGTGLNVLGGALLYPHFQVYGCDLNRVALETLKTEAAQLNLPNLHLQEMDLLNLDPDFGPAEGFDIIYSTGVIHHTADPVGILKSMASRLAPQGVLRLMVYGELGRTDLYRFARVARKLYGEFDWQERVSRARSLMQELEASGRYHDPHLPPVFRGPWEDAQRVDDVEFADRYLNPHDQPFTIARLQEAVEEAGLRFLDWFEPREWELERLLPDFAATEAAPVDQWEKFRLIEGLFDRPRLDLYLVGPDFQRRELQLSKETYLGLNPQLFIQTIKARGVSIQEMAQLRLGQEEPLTREEGLLIDTFGRRFITLEAIVSELPNPILERWLPVVEGLLEKNYLFSPHPLQ